MIVESAELKLCVLPRIWGPNQAKTLVMISLSNFVAAEQMVSQLLGNWFNEMTLVQYFDENVLNFAAEEARQGSLDLGRVLTCRVGPRT